MASLESFKFETEKIIHFEITGVSPLGMHHRRLADPTNEWAKKIAALVKARKSKGADKDAINIELSRAEFFGGMYWDEEHGPHVEEMAIIACLIEGAKATREGRQVLRGLNVSPYRIPLLYKGPRGQEELWAADFKDTRIVSLDPSKGTKSPKGPRTRPLFPIGWRLAFDVRYLPSCADPASIVAWLATAGQQEGLLDGRSKPRWGRFEITKVSGDPKAVTFWDAKIAPFLTAK